MVNKELERVVSWVIDDVLVEAGTLRHARDVDNVSRGRLLNAGHTFQRLAMEMFIAAGSVDE